MKELPQIDKAELQVIEDTKTCLAKITSLTSQPFSTVGEAILLLQSLRAEIYEDVNQIQHEYLILQAAKMLQKVSPLNTTWNWNARQTGTYDEPDLQGIHDGEVIFSAEATASARPIGQIDIHMSKTLAKLAQMQGTKYYFVRTEEMKRRAETKIRKSGWKINVQLLSH